MRCAGNTEKVIFFWNVVYNAVCTIIEIKYGGTVDYGRTDLPKMKMYAKSLGYDCQYYFAFIDERMEYLSLPPAGR